MEFHRTQLGDAWLISSDPHVDDRGFFARVRCAKEFESVGISERFVQTSLSHNNAAGTFRGLHYQVPPSSEAKLVRVIAGAVDDVIVDLRPDSPTFLRHQWFRLSADNLKGLYVPPGFAHGYLTVVDRTTLLYEMTDFYAPDVYRGVRWSDPLLSIEMTGPVNVINERDEGYPDIVPSDLDCFRMAAGES